MAQIDSGLGWSCDEGSYVAERGVLIAERDGQTARTATSKPTIVVGFEWHGEYHVAILSTDRDAMTAELSGMGIGDGIDTYTDTNGVVWYQRTIWASNKSAPGYNTIGAFVYTGYPSGGADFVGKMLEAANVTYPAKKIPSVKHMHEYTEELFKENNKRIANPNILGAKLFDSEVSYEVGEYVIYNGYLYKCVTAHTAGEWDENNFHQTNVLSESSSGGGSSTDTYSLTEIDTGKKWIDGKTVYRRVFDTNASANSGSVTINVNVNTEHIDKMIHSWVVSKGNSSQGYCMTYANGSGDIVIANATNNGNVADGIYLILEYTKTT